MGILRRSLVGAALAIVVALLATSTSANDVASVRPVPVAAVPAPAPVVADVSVEKARRVARSQSRLEPRTFVSAALGATMRYLAYLPPGYDSNPSQTYPTLYLLHGLGGTETQWIDVGVARTADQLIGSGLIPPMVIVMPFGEAGYWVDHANNGPKWGTATAVDLVGNVEATYRVNANRVARAVGGISMGAHGALQLALTHPGTFSAVGAHSLVLRPFGSAPAYFGDRAQYAQRDPVSLVPNALPVVRSLKLWIDIGDRDGWVPQAVSFDAQLNNLKVAHQWHQWPGDHSGAYWSAHVADYLRFYGAAFADSVG